MDQRIGDELAQRDRRKHGTFFAERVADVLVTRQQACDIVNQALETACVAALTILSMGDCGCTIGAVVGHEANGLARDTRIEITKALGKQDGAKVGDVPPSSDIGADEGDLLASDQRCPAGCQGAAAR